jgi:hypothetical protein
MSIQQGDEVELTMAIQGQTKIGTLIGQVSSAAIRDIGIRFLNEEGEWKIEESAIRYWRSPLPRLIEWTGISRRVRRSIDRFSLGVQVPML